MRLRSAVLAVGWAMFFAPPVLSQTLALPEYTPEQRWERLARGYLTTEAALIALGKEKGMTVEEIGDWLGNFYKTSWLGGREADQLLIGFRLNFMSWPGAEVEVSDVTQTSLTARLNRPWLPFFGNDRELLGMTPEEYTTYSMHIYQAVADWTGVTLEQTIEGDRLVMHMETRYELPTPTADQRWARGAYLSTLTAIQLLGAQMAKGMSAEDAGRADAKLYGPPNGWTGANTPWKLFRGVYWNQLSDPGTSCEVLEASPTAVRARCARPYVPAVETYGAQSGVTVNDFETWGVAFANAIAKYHGMDWTEQTDGDSRIVTVRKN